MLKVPLDVLNGLHIEKVERISQARRSKIQDELLVVFRTSSQRDVIQSYASNLAAVQGEAGIRLDVPDFLRGLFRQFEVHAANLKERYGPIKRAIRFDDLDKSLYMDVKLQNTDWHRISATDMKRLQLGRKHTKQALTQPSSDADDMKKILLQEGTEEHPHVVNDDDDTDNSSESSFKDACK